MSQTKVRERTKTLLKVMALPEMYFAEYQYYVETPEGDVMYFSDKKKASQFITFYNEYPHKRVKKKLTCTSNSV